jgi:hypothetical protein
MNAGQFYALVTALAGVILLLGWTYLTTGNPRSGKMLIKSVPLFVLPALLLALLPAQLVRLPFAMSVGVLIEELLKTAAATTENDRTNRFWLVALFGIWELTLAKPLWGLNHAGAIDDWTNVQLAGLTMAGIVTVLMHSVTAEIYAFKFRGRLGLALFASWALHFSFNESVDVLGVSLVSSLLQLAFLLLLFITLWPKNCRVNSHSREQT